MPDPRDEELRLRLEAMESPQAAGVADDDSLLVPCQQGHRTRPLPGGDEEPIVLALSGGGFRATLAALGSLRYLADAGLLHRVHAVSSVSGGGIANGVLATQFAQLMDRGCTGPAFDALVLEPVVRPIISGSLSRALIRNVWKALGAKTRTDVLADEMDRRWFHGHTLESLPTDRRVIFSAANLTTGARFTFTNDTAGDYIIGRGSLAGSGTRVADAVAISASVPGPFAPTTPRNLTYPCGDRYPAPRLVDGGAYDNLGVDGIDTYGAHGAFMVVCNAGGVFLPGPLGRLPLVRDLQKSNSSLYKQSTAVRSKKLIEQFKLGERWDTGWGPVPSLARKGVLFGLGTTGLRPEPRWTEAVDAKWIELVNVKTSFAQFSPSLCERLVRRGWWLCGASLATWHSTLVRSVPTWRPLNLG